MKNYVIFQNFHILTFWRQLTTSASEEGFFRFSIFCSRNKLFYKNLCLWSIGVLLFFEIFAHSVEIIDLFSKNQQETFKPKSSCASAIVAVHYFVYEFGFRQKRNKELLILATSNIVKMIRLLVASAKVDRSSK